MTDLAELNSFYCRWIEESKAEHRASAKKALEYMAQSTAKYHGRCVSTLYIPKMFTPEDITYFREQLHILYTIFDKVIQRYQTDREYRGLFGFSREMEELILLEPQYDCPLPMARIDIFYQEETKEFKFCEFNTDGSSAMNEDRELNHALYLTRGLQKLKEQYEISTFELFDTWVEESLAIYRSSRHAVKNPKAAIADFMESATNNEFEVFRERYQAHGIPCEICEIRQLRYRDKKLYTPSGMAVDFIYRRAVTSDIMKHKKEVEDFLTAVKEEAVCLIGDFRTQVIHNKMLYKVLHLPETLKFLTKEEQAYIKAHVPFTSSMDREDLPLADILGNKDKYILKPEDSYGSKGVFAGVEYESGEEWEEIVLSHRRSDYIIQEFCTPYTTLNIDFSKGEKADFLPVYNLTGLFTYGGKFAGIYSRVSRGKIISTQYSEIALPSILVSEKRGKK